MPGQDSHGIDVGVIEDLCLIRGSVLEAEFCSCMLSVQSAGRGDANQLNVTCFFDGGKQDRVGKQTCAQYSKLYRCSLRRSGMWKVDRSTFYVPVTLRVCQQHTQKLFLLLPRDHLIRLCGFFDRKTMCDQRLDVQLSTCHQVNDRFEVAPFGPPDVA